MAFIIHAQKKGADWQRHVIEHGEITIGRDAGNDLQCEALNVSRNHLRILHSSGRFIATDLNTLNGTYVNGRRIKEATSVDVDDRVYIGDWVLRFEPAPYVAMDPVEASLLEAIDKNGRDDDTRRVYGDWLEQQGRSNDAELVAIEIAIRQLDVTTEEGESKLRSLNERLKTLHETTSPEWRRLIARPPIEGCNDVRFTLTCPKRWEALTHTSDERIRACDTCDRNVYFARSVREAQMHARKGHCVALDLTTERRAGDLDFTQRVATIGKML